MKMRSKYLFIKLLVIIALFLMQYNSYAATYQLVLKNGKTTTIKSNSFSNREYISFSQVHYLLFKKYSYSQMDKEIYGKDFRLKVSVGSFYVLHESDNGIKIAQMIAPVININKKIYLPLESFFYSLPTLGLYDIEIHGNRIILKDISKNPYTNKPIAKKTYVGTFDDMNDINFYDNNEIKSIDDDYGYFEDEEISFTEDEYQTDQDFIHYEDNESMKDDIYYSEFDDIDSQNQKSQHKVFDDFNKYENEKDFSESQKFDRIEQKTEDYTYTEPALKFSFLFSSNYLKDGFKSIPGTKASISNHSENQRNKKSVNNINTNTEDEQAAQERIHTKKESPLFPPNVYVLPKHLIRRELEEGK